MPSTGLATKCIHSKGIVNGIGDTTIAYGIGKENTFIIRHCYHLGSLLGHSFYTGLCRRDNQPDYDTYGH